MPQADAHPIVGWFGANLRRLRARRIGTQQDLADVLGVSLRRVQQLESGRSNVTLEVLGELADALGVTPGMLLRKNNTPPPKAGRPRR